MFSSSKDACVSLSSMSEIKCDIREVRDDLRTVRRSMFVLKTMMAASIVMALAILVLIDFVGHEQRPPTTECGVSSGTSQSP